jgi:hypothetical protein
MQTFSRNPTASDRLLRGGYLFRVSLILGFWWHLVCCIVSLKGASVDASSPLDPLHIDKDVLHSLPSKAIIREQQLIQSQQENS